LDLAKCGEKERLQFAGEKTSDGIFPATKGSAAKADVSSVQ